MKKLVLITALLATGAGAMAKKVKFAVDMTGQSISANGVHVTGDFQSIAGYAGGDWQAATTTLTQEGSSNIYSIVVNIPAFAKYEYKFVNGDQFYDVEFVPEESRVGYNFNDNRWLYVDSLANDTTFVGAIQFAANAPAGLKLLRLKVDMQTQAAVNNSGVHVAGSFQGNDPAKTFMYSFGSGVYEVIAYMTAGSYTYQFYNGNTAAVAETVPAACASNGSRSVNLAADEVAATVCFSACTSCTSQGIGNTAAQQQASLYPNPADEQSSLNLGTAASRNITITDITGKTMQQYSNYNAASLQLNRDGLSSGLYFIRIQENNGDAAVIKWQLR